MLLWSPHLQQVVDVPDDRVQGGIASGEFQPFRGKVNVINPEGIAGTVEAEDLSDAFQAGYSFETAEDQAHRELREEYDDPMFAGIMGSLRGTTLGLSDVALAQGEGGNERAEALRVAQEQSPIASVAGEIVGAVAPALATGGGAGAVRGVGALPAGMAARAGRAVEAGVAAALPTAESAVGRIAARAAGVGAGGALEGAAYGAGQVLSEDALMGDDGAPLTAQQLIAGAGLGALVGGGAGVIFGGGLQGLSEIAAGNRRIADGVIEAFEQSEGVVADEGTKSFISKLVSKGGKWSDELGGFMFGSKADDIHVFTQKTAEGRWNVEVAFGENHHKVRELMLDDITDGYTDILDIVKRARIESGGELKLRGVEKSIGDHVGEQAAALRVADSTLTREAAVTQAADTMLATTAPEAQNFMRQFVDVLESIDQLPAGTMDRLSLIRSKEGLLGAAKQYMKEIDAIVGTTPGFPGKPKNSMKAVVELFDTLDRVKQRIGNPMRKVMKSIDPTEQTQNMRRFLGGGEGEAAGVYDEFRRFLERDDLWGKAGTMQRDVNEGASKYWRWLDHTDARRFAARAEKDLDKRGVVVWDQVFRGDRAGFKRFQNALGSGDEAEMAHFLMGSTDDLRGWVGTVKKNYELTGKGKAILGDAEVAINRFQKALAENKKSVTVQNQGKRLVESVRAGSGGTGMPLRGGTLGFILGGGPGAIVGAVAEQMFHPVKRIERIAKLQAAKKYFREKAEQIGVRMAKKVKSKKAPGNKLARIKQLRPGTVAFFTDFSTEGAPPKQKEDRVAGFKRVRQEIVDIASDPEKLNARLARTLGETMTVAPTVSSEIVQNAVRALQYLAQNMPTPPGMSLNPVRNLEEWVPSGREVSDFEARLRAIDDPLSVFDDLVDGTLSPAGAEAAQAIHNELIQGGVTDILAKLAELDVDVPRSDMIQLSMLAGIPLTWDMKPQNLLALQANYAAEQEQQQPTPRLKTPDTERMAEDVESRSEKLAEIA